MEQLKESISYYLLDLEEGSPESYAELEDELSRDDFVTPFSKISVELGALLSAGVITFEQFLELKNSYDERNQFLFTFEMTGPRTFGETWAQSYLLDVVPDLEPASKHLDPNYSGEYDCWYNRIRIEVKASRAALKKPGGKLTDKALYSFDSKPFDMNFQQIKPACCDVFVWMGVWRDEIKYWVLSSSDVANNKYFSAGQHRGNTGEGQLWIKHTNIQEFNKYLVQSEDILQAIIDKASQ